MIANHPSSLSLERLSLGELPGAELRALRQHVAGCERCQALLKQMDAQAASFSSSPHSSPARRGFVQADRAWKRKAMLVALAPLLAAAALFAVPPLLEKPTEKQPSVASVAPPPRAAQGREVLEVRPSGARLPPRDLRLRGVPIEVRQGALEGATAAGAPSPFVLKHTSVEATITGFVSAVTVTQEFENPFREPVEAVYVFPLPDDAAVDDMTLAAGARVIRASVQKRQEARRLYEEAKAQGRRAALLDQERPNIFTQSVANLLPGETVKVTLHYVAPLRYDDGEYTFNFPMVVGPRYVPGQALPGASQGTGTAPDTTRVIDASRVTPPLVDRAGNDVTVAVHLDAGAGVEAIWSASHRMLVDRRSPRQLEVSLDAADRIPNKDFILRWRVAGVEKKAALLASGGKGGSFALMVLPEAPGAHAEILPKELVFVIDTSCSMSGPPLEAAKRAMHSAIEQLNPDDTFMLIDFASTVSTFHSTPLPNTPGNVRRALAYLDALPAGGGTNQLEGLLAALDRPADANRLRVVLLMTDGFIGNEREIFAAAQAHLGKARLFGFGVGSAVNHYLLGRLSEIGRGFYQYVRPDEDPQPAVERFVRRIERPLLTDVSVDWGALGVSEVTPAIVPDLFDAQPLILLGRVREPGRGFVTVRGHVGGRLVETRLDVTLPEQDGAAPGLTAMWARAQIEALDRTQDETERAEVIRKITTLGLEYHLVTAYTSLVAVEQAPVTSAASTTVNVPAAAPDLTEGDGEPGGERTRMLQQKRFNTIQIIRGPAGATGATNGVGAQTSPVVTRLPPARTPDAVARPERPVAPAGGVPADDSTGSRGGTGHGSGGFDGSGEAPGGRYKKATSFNFEDDSIEGELVKPDAEYVEAREKAQHPSLVTPPTMDPARHEHLDKRAVVIPPEPGAANRKDSLGSSEIMAVLLANRPGLTLCAQQQRAKDPALTGTIILRFTVDAAGRVVKVEVVTEEFKDTVMARCLVEAAKTWVFPRHTAEPPSFEFPFRF